MATLQLNALGVPPLIGGKNIVLPDLLTRDTFIQRGNQIQQWGVYLGGSPVVTFDSFVAFDYRQGWALSDYPVERGGFQTYDKVQLPYDVRVKFASGKSEQNRERLLASVDQVAKSLQLYDVHTPEKIFRSVNVQHYDFRRTATNGVGLIVVEMWLLEVRVTVNDSQSNTGPDNQPVDANGDPVPQSSNPTVDTGSNTADPSGASPTNSGNVTGADTSANDAQLYIDSLSAGGF